MKLSTSINYLLHRNYLKHTVFVGHRSKLEVANHIKRLCKKNLNGFWEEISPLKTWSLFVELSECIGRENKKSESIEFFRSFVHQAVLLNAALVRINDDGEKNQIKNKINDLADQIVSNLASLNRTEPQHHDIIETTKAMKIHLTNMRKQAVTSVKNIPDCSSQSSEESKVRIIENIMKQITNDYNHLMKSISEECVKMLGDPHCQFAHLAMGSLSRGVVTPYSDFENGIVFEDTDEENDLKYRQCYFRSYAVLFEMIVVGFGEAPIRLAGIDCLNDFSTSNDREKDWFWDAFTTSGIQFDSHMPFASKTPLARSPTEKKPSTIELIGRKSDILEYLKQNRALKEGYHLAEMLAATSYVSGDVEFFNQYARDASVEMKKTFQSKESFEAMVHEYKRNLHEFSIDKEIKRYSSSLNVKKSLYRLFYVFLVHLERLTDVENHCNSSRYTIDHWLELNDGINKKAAHNLLYAFSLVNEARLKLYLQRTENADVVAGTMYLLNPKASTSVFSLLNKEDVVNAFAIGLSWNSALMEILPNIRKETDISTIKSYVLISLNTHLQQRHNFFQRGLILKHFQNYENALEAFRKCLNENDDKSIKVKVHNSIGQCHFGALQFSKASKEYESSLSIIQSMPEDIKQIRLLAEVQDWIGQCYAEIQPRDVPWTFVFAEKNLNESMDKWIHLRSEFPEDLSYTKGLADVLDSKGWMYYRKKDFENSLASYLEAAKLFDELESSSNEKLGLKDEIVNVQNGIALCYHELKRLANRNWVSARRSF